MKKHKFVFKFDMLEDRSLMSVGGASGFAEKFGGSMRMAPATEPIMYPPTVSVNDPIITLQGVSVGSIGGGVMVDVKSNNTMYGINSVKYEVSGAIKSQTWTPLFASYTTTTGETHALNAAAQDSFNFYWDENPGNRTIKVTVTFNDPASTEKSKEFPITVAAPQILMTTLVGNPIAIGKYKGDSTRIGITGYTSDPDALRADGVTIDSEIASAPTSGTFSFVQTTSSLAYRTESQTKIRELIARPTITAVDTPKDAQAQINMLGYTIFTPAFLPPQELHTDSVHDSPSLFSIPVNANTNLADLDYKYHMAYTFDTYLVWEPAGGGIKIAVDHIAWTYTADATYDGPRTDPAMRTEYLDPENWTVTSNHENGIAAEFGDKQRKILKWTTNTKTLGDTVITTTK